MNGHAYYNENDRFAAAWLRELIADRLIAAGDVDERSIVDVQSADLAGYGQCHFFAGIGGWSYALRLAGWPDERPVWTGSCPCQPLSVAGQRKGHADRRHLWPAFHRLIAECGPATVFGEQVASALGREWLAGIRADLETLGYAVGAADLCAAGVGAPHIRQRLYWMADAMRAEWRTTTEGRHHEPHRENSRREETPSRSEFHGEAFARMGDTDGGHGHWWSGPVQVGRNGIEGEVERGGRKYRAQWRVGPGIRIVADGIPNRVGALCGAGNAIVPQVAAEFIGAAMTPPHKPHERGD